MQFRVGEAVAWNQRGIGKEHVGTIFAIVPAQADPVLHVGYKQVRSFRINFSSKLRDHVSYLVLRPRTVGTKQDCLCWPRVGELRQAAAVTAEAIT